MHLFLLNFKIKSEYEAAFTNSFITGAMENPE